MQLGVMNNPAKNLFSEITWIADNGFDYIDLTIEAPAAAPENTDWQAVRDAIEDAGLEVVCHAAPYLPINNPSPLVRQAALDELRRCVDIAHTVNATLCTTHFIGWPAYLSEKAGYEYYRQLYEILIRHGNERGIRIGLENHPYLSHQLKHLREIFHRLPELFLLYDVGHGHIQEGSNPTRDYLFAFADRLAHVHMSDNDGTADDHLAFGAPRKNHLNLLRELQTLRSFQYDKTITLEVFGDRRWLLASAELVRELWEKAT